jgi:hypothetical protein
VDVDEFHRRAGSELMTTLGWEEKGGNRKKVQVLSAEKPALKAWY